MVEACRALADQLAWPTKGRHGEDGGKWKRLHYHTWTVDEGGLNQAWILMYGGVGYCNDPIEKELAHLILPGWALQKKKDNLTLQNWNFSDFPLFEDNGPLGVTVPIATWGCWSKWSWRRACQIIYNWKEGSFNFIEKRNQRGEREREKYWEGGGGGFSCSLSCPARHVGPEWRSGRSISPCW